MKIITRGAIVGYAVYIISVLLALCSPAAMALTFELNPYSDIVGKTQVATIKKGDTLFSIARRYDIGQLELQEANPGVNPNKLIAGEQLLIPTEFILPPGPREGLVLNLAELRVYYFPPGQNVVVTHPVGVGRLGWRTPIGETTIVRKRENPTWTPPASIRAHYARKGVTLPGVVAAGPNNPLGEYAMNLGWQNFLMHGTNKPSSVGLRSSSGCIRMYPEDIENIFAMVDVGTKIRVIYEPFKVGFKNGNLYLEAHELFPEEYYNRDHDGKYDLLKQTVHESGYNTRDLNWDHAKTLIKQTHGYPIEINSPRPGV